MPSRYLNWVFKLSASCSNTESKSFFEMTRLPYQWTPVANHSVSIARQSSARQRWLVLAYTASHLSIAPTIPHDTPMDEIWWLKYQQSYFKVRIAVYYLFTLKNVHLSTNSYKFLNATNIAMKLMEYVAWILLCKYCKFGENITTVPDILNFS